MTTSDSSVRGRARPVARSHRGRPGAAGVVTAALATALLAGCHPGDGWALERETQRQTYRQPITAIRITLDSGEASVSRGDEATVEVERRLRWPRTKPTVTEEWRDTTLLVTANCLGQSDCGTDFTFRVPAGTQVTVTSDGGSLSSDGLAGPQRLTTAGGDITVSAATGMLALRTDGGDITGTALSSARTIAETSGGEIALGFVRAPQAVTAQTQGGDIDVTAPPPGTGGYRVDASTDGGSLTVDIPSDVGAARSLLVHTDGGDVRVRYA